MLVDGQGNFGSVDGDSPAAMRYTEVRMSRIAHEILEDIDKETVEFVANLMIAWWSLLCSPLKYPTF